MYKSILKIFTLSLITLAVSCSGFQEEFIPIELEVANIDRFVVMNAEIEKDQLAWIQISYSEDINTALSEPIIFEENAIVTLKTSDGQEEQLNHKAYGGYVGSSIRGKVGETYTLTVDIAGEIYTATSTMFEAPGFQEVRVVENKEEGNGKGEASVSYSEEWVVNDPSDERNRYLFEWWDNGVHKVRRDWCIDDNRVVNVNEGLRLFNPTTNVTANNYFVLRAAEIDLITYNYFNMYEKIVRGMVGADSQTPYNPVSNFGEGTIGNFRAVDFSAKTVLTPPAITARGGEEAVELSFNGNTYFTKYHLYWDTKTGVNENSNKLENIKIVNQGAKTITYAHEGLTTGTTYFYKIQAEDDEGNVSMLSMETSAIADTMSSGGGGGDNVPNNTTAKSTGKGEITLNWDDVSGVDGYIIYWDIKPGVTQNSKYITVKGSPYIHTGLNSGQTYYYRIGTFIGKEIFLADEISAVAN